MAMIYRQSGDLRYLVDDQIPVPHAFTTRHGGVSTGIYESLNLGVLTGDDPDAVLENYRRITAALGQVEPSVVFSRQVHGATVRMVDQSHVLDDLFDPLSEGDGLVTASRGVALAVFAADCLPILLWDEGTGAVGAVHAGWRSTVQDIVGVAVSKLALLGVKPWQIRAAIGPGIGSCCFETGTEVLQAIRSVLGGEALGCVQGGAGDKFMVDLKEVNRRLLCRAGLSEDRITISAVCTMCDPQTFWSHRVTAGERGVQAAIILM